MARKPKTSTTPAVAINGDPSSEFFRQSKTELQALAAGKSAKAAGAQAELDRRAHNKPLKNAAKAAKKAASTA